jgi:hypothetical protein
MALANALKINKGLAALRQSQPRQPFMILKAFESDT